jgi:hypothetical protein
MPNVEVRKAAVRVAGTAENFENLLQVHPEVWRSRVYVFCFG